MKFLTCILTDFDQIKVQKYVFLVNIIFKNKRDFNLAFHFPYVLFFFFC